MVIRYDLAVKISNLDFIAIVANEFCAHMPQVGFLGQKALKNTSEDSLCLNIYRPKNIDPNSKLPIYVWIFWGAYVAGDGALPYYDGTSFAKNGVILVTINYRLHALGFYASKTTLNKYGTTGNWGHLDMIEALRWVQSHIESFGGDAQNVTIGGESAGSFAASALMLSPLANGLFNRAILESGTILSYPFVSFDSMENEQTAFKNSARLERHFHVHDNEAGLEVLRHQDPTTLASLVPYDYSFLHNSYSFLKPYFDGKVIPKEPYRALKKGRFKKVDLLVGYNTNEGTAFTDPKITKEKFLSALEVNFGTRRANAIAKLYPIDEHHSAYMRASEFIGDMMFNLGMKVFLDNTSAPNTVFAYHFDYLPLKDKKSRLGVAHASELPYTFNNFLTSPSEEASRVANETHGHFICFIKVGSPNCNLNQANKPSNLTWPIYDSSHKQIMRFGKLPTIEEFKLYDRLDQLETILLGDQGPR